MRGSPLLRALIVFALLLCLSPIIWKLTHAEAGQRVIAAPELPITADQEISIELSFTTAPGRVAISYLGKTVWEKSKPEASEDLTVKVSWPKEGGELKFDVEWPESDSLSAMRVKLSDPVHGDIERSLWGRGTKTGVLKFP